jgi:Cytochrome C oxidase subunit II, transmembrane domain
MMIISLIILFSALFSALFSILFLALISTLYSTLFTTLFSFNTKEDFIYSLLILNDAPEPWQLGFQDYASPGITGIVELHNDIFFFLVIISLSVFWILYIIIKNFNNINSLIVYKYWTHGTLIELI